MPFTENSYEETTNIAAEAFHISETCMTHGIPFNYRPAKPNSNEDDHNFEISFQPNSVEAGILVAMDKDLSDGTYISK